MSPVPADSRTVVTIDDPSVDYAAFFDDLKNRIRETQLRAAVAVNRELILL